MSYWKVHHGYMKSLVIPDYNEVSKYCQNNGVEIIKPKGKSWHRIEDATAIMLYGIEKKGAEPNKLFPDLNRGVSYYLDEILADACKAYGDLPF